MTNSQPTAQAEATHTVYVVQFWVERYEYWADCHEPANGMFDIPPVGSPDVAAGERKLAEMREASPTSTYRLIQRSTTETVLA